MSIPLQDPAVLDDYRRYAPGVLGLGRRLTAGALVAAIERGLPTSRLQRLERRYGLDEAYVQEVLGVSRSTLRRRRRAGRLDASESDRLLRIAGLYAMAEDILGDRDAAAGWMSEANRSLGGQPPARFALTEVGAREVEDLLGRLAHGVAA